MTRRAFETVPGAEETAYDLDMTSDYLCSSPLALNEYICPVVETVGNVHFRHHGSIPSIARCGSLACSEETINHQDIAESLTEMDLWIENKPGQDSDP